jgi:hypothetical protein
MDSDSSKPSHDGSTNLIGDDMPDAATNQRRNNEGISKLEAKRRILAETGLKLSKEDAEELAKLKRRKSGRIRRLRNESRGIVKQYPSDKRRPS